MQTVFRKSKKNISECRLLNFFREWKLLNKILAGQKTLVQHMHVAHQIQTSGYFVKILLQFYKQSFVVYLRQYGNTCM